MNLIEIKQEIQHNEGAIDVLRTNFVLHMVLQTSSCLDEVERALEGRMTLRSRLLCLQEVQEQFKVRQEQKRQKIKKVLRKILPLLLTILI